jgi:hypothetical protein
MDESDLRDVAEAAKELGESYQETACLLSGYAEGVQEANGLSGPGKKGTGAALVSFGVALIAFPEPTFISDVVGCGIVGAGLAYQRLVPPPLSVDDVYASIESQMASLGSSSKDLTAELGLSISPKKTETP